MKVFINDYCNTTDVLAQNLILSFVNDMFKEKDIARKLPMDMLIAYYKIYPTSSLITQVLKYERMKLLKYIIKTDDFYVKKLIGNLNPVHQAYLNSIGDLDSFERNHFTLGLVNTETDVDIKILYCVLDFYAVMYKEDKDVLLDKFMTKQGAEVLMYKNIMNYMEVYAEKALGD